MAYKIDYLDGDVLVWSLTPDGAERERISEYRPSIYVTSDANDLPQLQSFLTRLPIVSGTGIECWRRGFRQDSEDVLRADPRSIDDVRKVAETVTGWERPGTYRCYNVDLSREFRYCLETGTSPVPKRELDVLELDVPETELTTEHVTEATIAGETVTGTPLEVVEIVEAQVQDHDPDILSVNTSALLPALFDTAGAYGREDYQLGRLPGLQQLAAESTYESYGRVGHSPARYNVPGRVILDRSNTFFWDQANLDGCLDMVARSWKPLQELSWASIGNVLTAIQIREARERNVLVPWRSWRHEFFKTARQLDDADRGGFTFAPDVGFHENVHEVDFSSLYPNIIVTRNVSPETVRCDCHPDREDVPGLGYSICPERGYLPDVLESLVEDRDRIKAELQDCEDEQRRAELEGQSNAIKWILVSCFGYQGFSNAKFGRIECHEAINAFAREILLDAKEVFEANGWRVVHGIVDSLWVTGVDEEEQTPLNELCGRITDQVGIRLEHDGAYDWVAFVPRRDSDAGALTKYFGKRRDGSYKFRGIECRQRSTPEFVADVQRKLVEALDEHHDPERVCDELQRHLHRLDRGAIAADALTITRRVSQPREEYEQYTRAVAALERAAEHGLERRPGQSVSYVVTDDEKQSRQRVRLALEEPETYDVAFYRELLLRATESVLSPLGWRQTDIDAYLADRQDTSLSAYGTE